jgi:uncharacterized protein DUF2800
MINDHAFLPPSGASAWSKCALWPTMNAKYPQDESAEAIEGTAAHWVGWEILAGRTPLISTITPNKTAVTEEMLEGGELLVDTIRAQRLEGMYEQVEQRITCHSIHDKCDGTPDWWGFHYQQAHLSIVDYKFGHRFVDEFWNPQGQVYLSGIIDLICKMYRLVYPQLEQVLTVSFTIVQPRCFYKGASVRTHTFRLSECRDKFNTLANAAEAAVSSQPTATTNVHCIDCPGRHACQALQVAAYSDAEFSNNRIPLELSPAAAALELRMLSRALARLEARVDGLKQATLANIAKGIAVPFYRAEPGYGRRQWNVPDAQVIAMGMMSGKDLSKPSVITPVQATKLGIDENIVKAFSFVPTTAIKLIEAKASDAAKVFKENQIGRSS